MALLFCTCMAAQDKPVQNDSVKEKRDEMYKDIQQFSKKSKFTKFVHKLIFKPVREKEPSYSRRKERTRTPEMVSQYLGYEGKIIRNINIETLDPFGYSVNDTTQKPGNWVEKFGNNVHMKTRQFTIRNLLLFKQDERLDSLLVKESERLIRRQRYTRRVKIEPVAIAGSKDSVDIYIRVLDSWSLIPNGSASGTGSSIELTERNFLGLGHEFQNDFDKRFNTGMTSYLARYRVPNIKNTYIDAEIIYQIWQSDNSLKSAGLQREFFSPFTRWAGGAYAEERVVLDSLPNAQGEWGTENRKSNAQDYWGGYSFKIFKGFTEEDRTTNLITTGRYYNVNYSERPSPQYDSIGFFSDEKLYLASVGITSRKYVQDKFLFNYDIVEDIPIGKLYSITFGMQDKNNRHAAYGGGRYAFGNLYKWGYFSANAELGSYLYKGKFDQTILSLGMLYFTNIKDWGTWRFRHFIKPQFVVGFNRMPIITDQLNLNGDTGIPGFDSRTTLGTKKALLTLQTQTYSPWNLAGFRLNPFASFTMGILGNELKDLYSSKVYSKIGIGLLIYNDYLVFNSFQLSLAYYPSIPGRGNNLYQTNGIKNDQITLPNYQVGKPVTVPYQ